MDITDRLKRGAAWSALFIVAGGTAIVLAQAAAAPQAAPGAPQGPGPAPAGRAGGARGARAGAPAPPRSAKDIAPARPHRLLGCGRHPGLAHAHVDATKGRLCRVAAQSEGRRVADEWDPAKDEAAGEQCRAYGALNIMRLPGRLHVTWQDDQTLKVEADAGTQTRLLTFTPSGATGGDWQACQRPRGK
jgi:hypothetical protein